MAAALPRKDEQVGDFRKARQLRGRDKVRVHDNLAAGEKGLPAQLWPGHLPPPLGGAVTVLTYGTEKVGEGPRLHVHRYDETFIIIAGNARFFVGDTTLDASAGEIVFGPAGVPHRFENGPSRLQTIDIHHSPKWIQTDLD